MDGNVDRKVVLITRQTRLEELYDREVCTVIVDGADVALAQLEAGLAWWYRKYAHEQPPSQRQNYEGAESKASADSVGLWQNKNPMPPWEWRHRPK